MIIYGYNVCSRLGSNSNNNSSQANKPPCKSHLKASSLLSFSTYNLHSVWVNNEGQAYAIGENNYGQIGGSLPKETIQKDTEILIQDLNGHTCKFLSAVCGTYYTLYLVSTENDNIQLIYSYFNHKQLFLDINGRIPQALFGGSENAAAIDSEGGILVITKSVFTSSTSEIKPSFLPNNDKAIKVACCNKFIVALGSSGHVYESPLSAPGKIIFNEVKDLQGHTFVDIAGTFLHCFAVCKDGRVFGIGNNWKCKLAMSKETKNVSKFTIVESLKKYKIVAAFAGYDHSLFKTSDGKILACGSNANGEILLNNEITDDIVFPPVEMTGNDNIPFCIAGSYVSIMFQDGELPNNLPNQKIDPNQKLRMHSKSGKEEKVHLSVDEMQKLIELKEKEIERLTLELLESRKEIMTLRNKEKSDKLRISELEKKLFEKDADFPFKENLIFAGFD